MKKSWLKNVNRAFALTISMSLLTACGGSTISDATSENVEESPAQTVEGSREGSIAIEGEIDTEYNTLTTLINSYQPPPAGHGNPSVYGGPDSEMDPIIFDYLCDYSPAPEKIFKPSLLESYEFNDRVMTLKLKPDLKWSDGSPLTIDDVLATFYMEIASSNLGKYTESITRVDDLTLTLTFISDAELLLDFTLKTPVRYSQQVYGEWVDQFKSVYENMRVYNEEDNIYHFSEEGDKIIATINESFHQYLPAITDILCSGPYVAVSTNSAEIIFEKNEHYRIDVPIQRIRGMRQVNLQSTTAAIVDKEFDLEAIGVSLELHKEIMKDETIREVLMPEYSSIGYSYNISSYPTDIPEIRKAMSYAVDKEVIAPISEPGMVAGDMYSLGLPPSLTSNYVDETFLDTLEKYTYDIDKATELMESIGWTKDGNMWVDQNGESPEIVIGTIGEWTATLVTGEAISEMLKDFGFNVTFKPMEVVTFYEFANSGETNLAVDFYPSSVSIQHPYEAYNSLWGVAPRMGIDLPGYGEKFEFVNPESGETFDWGEKTELLFNANTHEETTELVKEFMQFSNDMVLSMPITEKFIVTRIHNPKLVLAEVEMGTPVLDYYWTQGKNYHLAKMLRDGKLYFIK